MKMRKKVDYIREDDPEVHGIVEATLHRARSAE